MVIAWQDPGRLTEYASSPTPFWMVKLMDLGIIVPAAIAAGVGLFRGAEWAVSDVCADDWLHVSGLLRCCEGRRDVREL
jgi:hypothetical protein